MKSYAEGVLELEGSFVERKVEMRDGGGNGLGVVFVNARVVGVKSSSNKGRDVMSVDKIKFSTIDPSRLNRYQ